MSLLDINRRGPGFRAKLPLLLQEGILSIPLGVATAWAAATFAANWSDFNAASSTTCAYRKDATGRIYLKGLAKKSTALVANDPILTLPVGFRPTTAQHLPAGSSAGYAQLAIQTTGDVYLEFGGSATWTAIHVNFEPAT